ncbi:MAG TPA: AI-2E family transporter [Sedimenticola thiotaurini]|uniref:AI-2E family transporter n=1 Tax=Sedimenticola thiotaurini TaxID=1543721 RepID=A0A831RLN5_9GAMM|nr:AI-2E family transporter [Sedimenticola thiotaurini]
MSLVAPAGRSPVSSILVTAAALVIVIAGMREAQALLVPFLLAAFIAVIVMPAVQFMVNHRIPTSVAIFLVILLILGAGLLLGGLVGRSADDFSAQLPLYQQKFAAMIHGLQVWLSDNGLMLTDETVSRLLDPGRAMAMAAQGLSSLSGLLTNAFLILLTVLFILFEASGFPAKLRRILPDPASDLRHIERMLNDIKRYMAIKTLTSLLTGILIYLALLALGVDFPLLWGMIAFFLNYVPNIGSLIAAIPPILLALVQLGTGAALWTTAIYLLVNNLVGNVIEPRFMGRGLGLSTLVVFVSLVFWGWVLGLIGMFLSVPLTMTLKIALDSREDTRWIAILLGPEIGDDEEPAPAPRLPADRT